MRMRCCLLMIALAMPVSIGGQELTGAARQRLLETARSRYYSLTGLGVKSFTCAVDFDFSTLSKGLLPVDDLADRTLLQSAVFTLKVTPSGPALRFKFPEGARSQSEDVVASVTLWISELVQGFFQTWPLEGFSGPIPAANKRVLSVAQEGDGFRVSIEGPGGPLLLRLDKNLTVTEVQAQNGAIVEHPTFTGPPEGLMFTGNDTQDIEPGGTTRTRYAIDIGRVDGFLLPQHVHLLVGEHVDVRFGLSGCKVARKH